MKNRRITPAYAGKRRRLPSRPARLRDHPRLRGEKPAAAPLQAACSGSPPLTRGKVDLTVCCLLELRITPAYAGKSRFYEEMAEERGDHPRLRGEKIANRLCYPPDRGSPPLTRGKVYRSSCASIAIRITPAYAGKSALRRAGARQALDHPRLRGEKYSCSHASMRCAGSPPLTRGKD